MKIFRVVLALAFVFVAFGAASGASAGAFTYTSGFQVQNLEATQASIGITFYNQDGSVEADVTDTVDANGSKTYFPLTDVADGFNGSVVIASSTQVAAIGNVLGDGATAAASYSASASGSTTVRIPLLMQDNAGYYTWFNVQNTGSSVATVNVAYSDGTSASASIQPGAAATFDQATETHTQAIFAAEVTSDQPIAATVIEEKNDAQGQLMFAYSGFTGAGSTDPVMPLINANNAGYVTGVQIQNAGDADTEVTVSYTPAGPEFGTACTETRTIAADSSATFALFAFNSGDSSTCTPLGRFVGSAQVTSNSTSQPLFLIVNQLNLGAGKAEAYNGFDTSAATAKVVMPLIMDRNAGYFTGFNVMNIGSEAAVTCTFTDSSYTVSATLASGAALNDIQNNKMTDTPPYIGSGTCTAESGGALLAVVNEIRPGATDLFLVYEGANAAP